jgi:hypothetical protein
MKNAALTVTGGFGAGDVPLNACEASRELAQRARDGRRPSLYAAGRREAAPKAITGYVRKASLRSR